MGLMSKLFGGKAEGPPPAENEPLVIVPIPTLVSLLVSREEAKGSALTEAEVLAIRDGAVCITMPASVARKVAEARGYQDLDPENVWEDWRVFGRAGSVSA